MASRSTNSTSNNNGGNNGGDGRTKLITKAVRYSRTIRKDRNLMRDLLILLNHPGIDAEQQVQEVAIPPRAFRNALRKPKGSKRKTIAVWINGERVPLLLNPQGKVDPEREQWLWNYTRNLVREVRSGR